jgi:uncharacterized membrane protein
MDFLPTPLHPLIVHLPIAMTVLLPLFGLGALIAIRRGSRVLPVWALATAMIALTLGSGLLAKETGEDEEDAVEKVVAEEAIGPHEEAADAFIWATGVVLVIAGVGFVGGSVGSAARVVAAGGTLAVLGFGYNVGHTGGQLVYRDGAAAAYTTKGGATPGAATSGSAAADDDRN